MVPGANLCSHGHEPFLCAGVSLIAHAGASWVGSWDVQPGLPCQSQWGWSTGHVAQEQGRPTGHAAWERGWPTGRVVQEWGQPMG